MNNRFEKKLLGASILAFGLVVPAVAADIQAGSELAVQCAACHGDAGVSTDKMFPNLAGQKADYLKLQLEAFKKGERKNPLMNAIASGLEAADIDNLSAHFAGLSGAAAGAAAAENTSGLDGSAIKFPTDYKKNFTRYFRKDFDNRKQVRYYFGNEAALEAVKKGGAFPSGAYFLVEVYAAKTDANGDLMKDADGKLIQGDLKLFTAMEKRTGWGDKVPEIYKNDDWRYAVFQTDGTNKAGVNEAPCMACHKPLTDVDYSFTYGWVKDFLPTKKEGYEH